MGAGCGCSGGSSGTGAGAEAGSGSVVDGDKGVPQPDSSNDRTMKIETKVIKIDLILLFIYHLLYLYIR